MRPVRGGPPSCYSCCSRPPPPPRESACRPASSCSATRRGSRTRRTSPSTGVGALDCFGGCAGGRRRRDLAADPARRTAAPSGERALQRARAHVDPGRTLREPHRSTHDLPAGTSGASSPIPVSTGATSRARASSSTGCRSDAIGSTRSRPVRAAVSTSASAASPTTSRRRQLWPAPSSPFGPAAAGCGWRRAGCATPTASPSRRVAAGCWSLKHGRDDLGLHSPPGRAQPRRPARPRTLVRLPGVLGPGRRAVPRSRFPVRAAGAPFRARCGRGSAALRALGAERVRHALRLDLPREPGGRRRRARPACAAGTAADRAPVERFATGFGHEEPLGAALGPDGALYVSLWKSGRVVRLVPRPKPRPARGGATAVAMATALLRTLEELLGAPF